jgi:hypothetical protein
VSRIDERRPALLEMPEFGESRSFDILRPGDGNSQVLGNLPIGPGRLFGEPIAMDDDELFARFQLLQGGKNVAAEGPDNLEGTRIQEGTFQSFTSTAKRFHILFTCLVGCRRGKLKNTLSAGMAN